MLAFQQRMSTMRRSKQFTLKKNGFLPSESTSATLNESLVNQNLFPKDNLSGALYVSPKPTVLAFNIANNLLTNTKPAWLKTKSQQDYKNARLLKKNFDSTWEAFKNRFYQEIKVIKSMMTINEGSLQAKKAIGTNSLQGEHTIK
jgi:hypothetical protein